MTVTEPRAIRWSREEYYRLADCGFFEGRRVELIRGEIIDMTPQESPHATGVGLAGDALRSALPRGFTVREQSPLSLGSDSDPEADVAVVQGSRRDYADQHPSTALLVVEVAASSLDYDRTTKAALYAEAGIPEYWIVNLRHRQLEVHREPGKRGNVYGATVVLKPGETVVLHSLPGVAIEVSDLLP